MMDWWRAREPREQLLVALGGVVFVLVVVIQFVIIPVIAGKADARQVFENEARMLDAVVVELASRPVALAAGSNTAQSSLSGDALRTAVTTLARERGLSVARVQSGADGRISIAMESADPKVVFSWISECRAQYGVVVSRATLSESRDGTVRASIEVEGS